MSIPETTTPFERLRLNILNTASTTLAQARDEREGALQGHYDAKTGKLTRELGEIKNGSEHAIMTTIHDGLVTLGEPHTPDQTPDDEHSTQVLSQIISDLRATASECNRVADALQERLYEI